MTGLMDEEQVEFSKLKNGHQKLIYIPRKLNEVINNKSSETGFKQNSIIKDALLFYIDHNWGASTPSGASIKDLINSLRAEMQCATAVVIEEVKNKAC